MPTHFLYVFDGSNHLQKISVMYYIYLDFFYFYYGTCRKHSLIKSSQIAFLECVKL